MFPISRDPPEGGTVYSLRREVKMEPMFPISRDPPEGGTVRHSLYKTSSSMDTFPISRDPPEGGTH